MKTTLKHRSHLLRAGIARGLSASDEKRRAIDPAGGEHGAGIIRGMAILSVGEANGHGLWCDQVLLSQVCDAINAAGDQGIKARFTHPDMSGDGLGKFTGRCRNATLDGDVVRGDLHFSAAAHDTPDGDLAGYLLALATEDPTAFGNSIAFERDEEAEAKFLLDHGATLEGDYFDARDFKSPDAENADNLPHARLQTLRSVDAVDDPAANPTGLFRRGDDVVADAEKLLAYSLGLSSARPKLAALDIDPDRGAGFVHRFLKRHQLTLSQEKGLPMPPLTPRTPAKGMSTAELDRSLAQKFASGISTGTKKLLSALKKGKFAADKEDRDEDRDREGQESGDADKDEGEDKDEDESGGDFSDDDDDEKMEDDDDEKEELDDDEKEELDDEDDDEKKTKLAEDGDEEDDEDTTGLSAKPKLAKAKLAKLAKGGDKPSAPGDQGSVQDDYQKTQEEESEGSEKDAEEGTPVKSPSKEKKKGLGPLGDASNNVGYSKAVKDCQRFTAAFGPQGAVWFGEGKTFSQATKLHAAAQAKEIEALKKHNAELAAKSAKHRGLSKPLAVGGESSSMSPEQTRLANNLGGGGMARFAVGLAEQMSAKKQ